MDDSLPPTTFEVAFTWANEYGDLPATRVSLVVCPAGTMHQDSRTILVWS
jgi:hypothetical protein